MKPAADAHRGREHRLDGSDAPGAPSEVTEVGSPFLSMCQKHSVLRLGLLGANGQVQKVRSPPRCRFPTRPAPPLWPRSGGGTRTRHRPRGSGSKAWRGPGPRAGASMPGLIAALVCFPALVAEMASEEVGLLGLQELLGDEPGEEGNEVRNHVLSGRCLFRSAPRVRRVRSRTGIVSLSA